MKDKILGQMMKNVDIGQMLSMIGCVLPKAAEPTNLVAEFLSGEIQKLYPEQNEITGMIEGAIVDMANNDPDMALRVLLTLYNDIGEFYQGMQSDDNPD